MSNDTALRSESTTPEADLGAAAEAVPMRVLASVLGGVCAAEGVRPPTLRTLRFWRDKEVLDPPTRLGFTRRHAAQALAAARARSAGEDLDGLRTAAKLAGVHMDAEATVAEDLASLGRDRPLAGVAMNSVVSSMGPGGCMEPPFSSQTFPGNTTIPGGWPSYPSYPDPLLPGYPDPNVYPSERWRTVPSTTTTFFTTPPVADLARVSEALESGDAEAALEHLDAVIRDALRDPDVDLVALRALRTRLEDVIAEHRAVLSELQGDVDGLRDTDDPGDEDPATDDEPAEPGSALGGDPAPLPASVTIGGGAMTINRATQI